MIIYMSSDRDPAFPLMRNSSVSPSLVLGAILQVWIASTFSEKGFITIRLFNFLPGFNVFFNTLLSLLRSSHNFQGISQFDFENARPAHTVTFSRGLGLRAGLLCPHLNDICISGFIIWRLAESASFCIMQVGQLYQFNIHQALTSLSRCPL